MLTIKSPITITCNPSMTMDYDGFSNRITGNYQMMTTELAPEDFLHMVTAPPEVFIADGGMTQLVTDTSVQNNQNIRLDMINNVINRIVLAGENHLTYQDQVYISNVLSKIGIKQVDAFMSQVRMLKDESRSIEQLVSLYWNHFEDLQEISRQYHQMLVQKQQGEREEQASSLPPQESGETPAQTTVEWNDTQNYQSDSTLYLHQEIMNRLKTGAIYQEVKNFSTGYYREDYHIHQPEMMVSEQAFVAQNILLNKLSNDTYLQKEPLIYQHVNTYEHWDENVEQWTEQQVQSQLVEAVMLNVVDRVFSVRLPQIMSRHDIWYNMSEALYQAAENTLMRFEHYHRNPQYSTTVVEQYSKDMHQSLHEEIASIRHIVDNRRWENREWTSTVEKALQQTTQAEYRNYQNENSYPTIGEDHSVHLEWREGAEEHNVWTDEDIQNLNQTINRLNQQNVHNEQQFNQLLNQQSVTKKVLSGEEIYRQVLPAGQERIPGKPGEPDTTIYQTNREDHSVHLEWKDGSEEQNVWTNEDTVNLNQTINRLNQQNVHNEQQLEQLFKQQNTSVNQTNNEEHSVSLTWQENSEENNVWTSEATENLELTLNRINQQNVKNEQQLRQILQKQTVTREKIPDRHRTRQEGLRALENPQEVVLEYCRQAEQKQELPAIVTEEWNQLMSPETVQIFKTLAQYHNNPKTLIEQGIVRQDAQGELIRDILLEEQRIAAQQKPLEEEAAVSTTQKTVIRQDADEVTELIHNQKKEIDMQIEQEQLQQQRYPEQLKELIYRDVVQEHELSEQIESETKIKTAELTHQVVQQWHRQEAPVLRQNIEHKAIEQIAFVHKQQDNSLDEEFIEEIMQQNQKFMTNITKQEEIIRTEKTENRQVYQTVNQTIDSQSTNIERMVQQGMQSRLDELSEQVYNRLERRLNNERMRRGR